MVNRTHEPAGRLQGASAEGARDPGARPGGDPGERAEPTLADLAWSVVERRWTVATIVAAALVATAAFLLATPPVYESRVLVQVGGRARPAAPEDVIRLFDTTPPVEGEMRLLRSRPLLEAVVEQRRLDLEVRPRTLPLVGAAVARRHQGTELAQPPPGLGRWAWGGERLRVDTLAVGDALLDEPLVLVAGEGGAFELRVPGAGAAAGVIGAPLTSGAGDRQVSLLVSELHARPGTEFLVRKLRRQEVVERLQKALAVKEQGRDTGLVELALEGTDPGSIAGAVETLATLYVRQSLEETSAEAANALRVLEEQLPELRAKLTAAEGALDRFHRRNATVNLSVDGHRLMLRLGELDGEISEAQTAAAELARRHTGRYPEPTDPEGRLARLRAARAGLEAQLAALPGLELEYARLVRQVGVATERHTRAVNRADELRTVKSSWGGNARVVEHAVEPLRPVGPKHGLALALALLIGVAGGLVAAFLRSAFDAGIRDPDEIEASTGVPVFATIPRSAAQRRGSRRAGRRGRLQALSVSDPGDAAVEHLRALRTGVEFALRRAANNVVVVGSPAPSAGKSFVSVNLAHLLAAFEGRRVLLVDGDLRRGVVHRHFAVADRPGVSDVLAGQAALDAAIHKTDVATLDVIPMGKRVTNPAELLGGAAFQRLLEEVRARYDVVIVDTAPILAVTDSALIARSAGVTLLVVRAGEQNVRDVSLAVKRLVQNGATVRGAVLNDVKPTLGHYGRSGAYRAYGPQHA